MWFRFVNGHFRIEKHSIRYIASRKAIMGVGG